MICRKCGAEIPDNALRCEHCGIKVNMYCPECNTLNPFGSKYCSSCGFELIKICPKCNASNLFSAVECRKCHHSFQTQTLIVDEPNITEDLSIVRPFSASDDIYSHIENANEIENQNANNSESEVQKVQSEKIFQVEKEDFDQPVIENVNITQEVKTEELLSDIDIEPIEEVSESIKTEILEPEPKNQEEENFDNTEYDPILNAEIQVETVQKSVHLIKTSLSKHVIAINGPEGSGKSAVLKQVHDNLTEQGFVCLYGSCTPLLQITSFGFFQDAFLRMMGFPPYTNSIDAFIKEFKKSDFAKAFNFLNSNELNLFLNIFYPTQKDDFALILDNKNKMFSIMEKVIKSFLVNNNLIIEIDNFEFLDGASYDFLMYMLNKGYFNNRLKMLVAYGENKLIQSYFDLTDINENIFETIVINKLDKKSIYKALKNSALINIDEVLNEEYLEKLIKKSCGNAIRFEQEVGFLFDTGYISQKGKDIFLDEDKRPESEPESIEELLKLRLNALRPAQKNVLFMAAIMGFRFATGILCMSVATPVEKTEKILESLIKDLYIIQVDDYTCEFKNLALWKLIYQEAKADLLYKENSEHLYETLKSLVLSSNIQKLISCEEALSKQDAYLIWQDTAGICAKLGDTNLYVIAQKQALKLLDEIETDNSDLLKAQIYEEIGKLLCDKSPKESITYLSNVLDADIKNNNLCKIIDVSSYFIRSCYHTGNYFGAVEAVDSVIKALTDIQSDASQLDIALIKTRKLKALLNIGNCEQVINLINEDIVSELELGLNSNKFDTKYKNHIIEAWLTSKLTLAKAYCIQGNNCADDVISVIKDFLEKYDYNKEFYLAHLSIIEALAKTVSGDIIKSGEILTELSKSYNNKTMNLDILTQWNLVNIINRVLLGQNKDLKVDLFEFAAFANNINEYFIKNIIKLILGYIIKKEGNTPKALEIFNEQITYFAKEKVAMGALLSWALIVNIYLEMGEFDNAFNTASKSLEIAQSSKINNNFFIITFQKALASIYIQKQDFTAAKMYLEKSLMLAKQFNLKYQLIELYIAFAQYTLELMKYKHIYSQENLNTTLEMYNKAVKLAKELQLGNMVDLTTRERAGFKTFCQLHSLSLE